MCDFWGDSLSTDHFGRCWDLVLDWISRLPGLDSGGGNNSCLKKHAEEGVSAVDSAYIRPHTGFMISAAAARKTLIELIRRALHTHQPAHPVFES